MPSNECRNLPSRGSGTPCESSYGRLCVLRADLVESHTDTFIGRPTQFPTERTDRELLEHPAARYSAVLVLHVVEWHANACIGGPAQFPTERTDREPLGRSVVRYSAALVFDVVKSRRIACRCLQTMHGAICHRMNRSRASGTPCGSSYSRFCVWL